MKAMANTMVVDDTYRVVKVNSPEGVRIRVEGQMLRAATGGFILNRVDKYLEKQHAYSRFASIDKALVDAMCIVDIAASKCFSVYCEIMKEYSEL